MDEWITLVNSVGFPIFVSLYYMLIHQKAVKELSTNIRENTFVLRELKEVVKNGKK